MCRETGEYNPVLNPYVLSSVYRGRIRHLLLKFTPGCDQRHCFELPPRIAFYESYLYTVQSHTQNTSESGWGGGVYEVVFYKS
jgi:hypothetical protein